MRVQKRTPLTLRTSHSGNLSRSLLVLVAMFALAACGGGGGGGGDAPAPANPPASPNQAPQVDAGTDQTIQLPTNTVTLRGTATDEPGSTLVYTWSVTPADGVTIADPSAAETSASFASVGTYTFTLSVSDGSSTGTDTVQVVVQPAAAGDGFSVDAGADQTIELPVNTVSLSATVTANEGATLTYAWTAEPAVGVAFADASAAATNVTFTDPGTYTLTLTVSDGEASVVDSLTVIVQPPVYPLADTDTDPAHGWTVAAPADVGMDEALLEQARVYAEGGGGSGVIVRHGRLVYSWGDIDTRYDVKSTTKSIGSIALGLALDEGRLALSDLVQTHLPTFLTVPPQPAGNVASGWLDDITVLQLATHTAGFDKPGGYGSLLHEPGTRWLYSDGGLNWLADLLTQVFAEDLSTLLATRVWSVLGIDSRDDLQWRDNQLRPHDPLVPPDGIPRRELASGITVNTNAMARIGLLFLRNGEWAGQQVLSPSFIEAVRTPRPELAQIEIDDPDGFPQATTNYGLLWWTNATGLLPNVPRDAYWAWGLGDSLIVVIPSLDLVVARTGNDPFSGLPVWRVDWNGDYSVLAPFLDPIVQSVQQ